MMVGMPGCVRLRTWERKGGCALRSCPVTCVPKPTSQVTAECLVLKSVGIKRERKRKGLLLTASALSSLEELVSVSCGE